MLPVVLLHDVDGPEQRGFRLLAESVRAAGHDVIVPASSEGWWANESLTEWARTDGQLSRAGRAIGIGVGSGGQSLLRAAFGNATFWPAVAAIAPASDLGRWYGRGTELDALYANLDAARQDEAPLHFNPLSRPAHILCWCDPRDAACTPSALRVTSKLQSSGVPITADLTTEVGEDRDGYVAARIDELIAWLTDARDRLPVGSDLPVIGTP